MSTRNSVLIVPFLKSILFSGKALDFRQSRRNHFQDLKQSHRYCSSYHCRGLQDDSFATDYLNAIEHARRVFNTQSVVSSRERTIWRWLLPYSILIDFTSLLILNIFKLQRGKKKNSSTCSVSHSWQGTASIV